MILKSIEMSNFRNYEREEFHFHEGTNVLYGDNAQGKTNVLEAIYLGGTTKSHKGSKDSDMIMKGKDEAHIRYYVEKKQCTYKIEIHMRRGKTKGIAIDGLPIGSSKELMGLSHIIFFSPEDLGIIKDGPEQRRRFMDMELSQLDKIYLSNLVNYNKVLNQRNKLLKDIAFSPSEQLMQTLDIWDMQLVKYGSLIIKGRKSFIEKINTIISDIHSRLTGGIENIKVCYVPDVDVNDFEEEVRNSRQKDIKYKVTGLSLIHI